MFTDKKKPFWIEEATLSPAAQIPMHSHRDTWELNFIKRGKGVRTLGKATEPFNCGDIVLTPPRIKHFWDFRPWKKNFCTYCVFIRECWIKKLQHDIPSLTDDLAPLVQSPISLIARGNLKVKARQILKDLSNQKETEQAFSILELLLLFAQSTTEADRIEHAKTLTPQEQAREKLRLYFVCNYMRPIQLEDAAREFGKGRTAFCNHVKQITGKTFVDCLTETRLEKACEYLETTAKSVAEVATCVGFSDAAYFSKVFSHEKKMSPLAWRKQHSQA